MSEKNRPNLNAVGVAVDIMNSLEKHIRGKARKAGTAKVYLLLSNEIQEFVEKIDTLLNEEYGGIK